MKIRWLPLVVCLAIAIPGAVWGQPQPIEEILQRIRGSDAGCEIYRQTPGIQTLVEFGIASWYKCPRPPEQIHDRTRNIQDRIYPAAHKTLPFGTLIKVINPANARKILCRVIDRGPFITGRIIDLDSHGAKAIGISGVGRVIIKIFASKPLLLARR